MKQEFDDIIRRKWEEKYFPVDAQHRDDMIRLLDKNKRRRLGFLWWLTGAGSVIILVAALFLFGNSASVDPELKIEDQKAEKNKEMAAAGKDDYQNNDLSAGSTANTTGSHSEGSANNSPKNNDALIPSNTTSIYRNETNKMNSGVNSGGKEIHNEGAILSVKNTKGINQENVGVYNQPDDLLPETREGELTITKNNLLSDGAIANEIREEILVEDIQELTFSSIDHQRSEEMNDIQSTIVMRRPVGLFAEAGFGFVPASAFDQPTGWNIRAGAGAGFSLNHSRLFTIAGGYMYQQGGIDFEKISTVQSATFGTRSNFHSLSPEKLHFAYARAGIHQHVRRHLFSLFSGVQYLYGAQGTITIQSEDQFEGLSETNKSYGWLNLDGMNRWLWSAEITYGYLMTPRLSLQAGMRFNISNIKANDPELTNRGYYWNGSSPLITPSITINYHLYGKR